MKWFTVTLESWFSYCTYEWNITSKNIPLRPIHKLPRHERVGPSEKASLGGQTGGSANKKKKVYIKDTNTIWYVFSLVMDINSQASRETFGVKTSIGGGGGLGGEKERKERKDMLRAGQSRGSIVCVNGVIHYKT